MVTNGETIDYEDLRKLLRGNIFMVCLREVQFGSAKGTFPPLAGGLLRYMLTLLQSGRLFL